MIVMQGLRAAAFGAVIALTALVAPVGNAQTPMEREPVMIAPSKRIDATALEANATGFFINDSGDVLTARHVIDACQSLFLIKDGQVARARIKAVSADRDLAVIGSRIKPLLTASFVQSTTPEQVEPVFAAGYEVLQHMPDRLSTIYNAFTRGTSDDQQGEFTMTSAATNGASGSPVLNQAGLVTERALASSDDPRAYAGRSGAARYVIAVADDPIKAFLAANHVPFNETNTAQLEPMQPHAPRAATLEAGVLCGK